MSNSDIGKAYELSRERYAQLGVDTEKALKTLESISLSIHCWQGDDVGGFEKPDARLEGGGIQVTGNYPGKARTIEELRMDLEKVYSLVPGRHRLSLHAIYGEFGGRAVDRNEIQPEHFTDWVDWARDQDIKLDFNATCFSHPKAEAGFTLSSKNKGIREFWIEHVKQCRAISAVMGRELGSPCVHNLWIPDGSKDIPIDRLAHRDLLNESLDKIFAIEYDPADMRDALESKLFGIGSEAFVVGSHEFYLGYALTNGKMICLDLGHFHPTESVADKISAVLQFSDEILLHITRAVRWDSDHVVILNDDTRAVAEEIVRGNALERVHIGLDYFDASINRIGAWVIGARAALKAFLMALLEPGEKLKELEHLGDNFGRLALLEELKTMPVGAVWDYYCLRMDVPPRESWMDDVRKYESGITGKRS
jgi:L-rhamnose isomerase